MACLCCSPTPPHETWCSSTYADSISTPLLFQSHQWPTLSRDSGLNSKISAQRKNVNPCARLAVALCGLLVLPEVVAQPGSGADYFPPTPADEVIRFRAGPFDSRGQSRAKLVTGNFVLHGDFTLDHIGELALSSELMLSNMCGSNLPTLVQPRIDAKTVGSERPGLNILYHILAPDQLAPHCVMTIRWSSFGPPIGPYGNTTPPAVRGLWTAAAEANKQLPEFDYKTWSISLINTYCGDRLASYGVGKDSPEQLIHRTTLQESFAGKIAAA